MTTMGGLRSRFSISRSLPACHTSRFRNRQKKCPTEFVSAGHFFLMTFLANLTDSFGPYFSNVILFVSVYPLPLTMRYRYTPLATPVPRELTPCHTAS